MDEDIFFFQDGRNVRPTRKIDYNPSKEEKVELRKAENRWTRSEKMSGDVSVSEETEEVFRKFQVSITNVVQVYI